MALRTGDDYRRALKDGREVYLDGRRVDDVTTESGFRPVVDTFARMYDLQHTDEFRDVLTFEDDGQRCSGSWIVPRDRRDVVWRRRLTELVARYTGGLFGRAPDYVPLFHLGMLDIKRDFSRGSQQFERNIENYWYYARERDLSLAHAFVDVQADPSVPVDDTPVPKIVAKKEDGILVRGAKTVATFTPYADEILVGSFMRAGIKDHHVMYFSIPVATPGLRVVARQVYGEGTAFDHPVSMYGDENDSILILDDVLVPWERVFNIGDPGFCQTIFPRITEWAHWSIVARLAVKAEVLVGLCALIPEIIGRDKQPQAQEVLGEAIRYLLTLRAFLYASEDGGAASASDYWMPDPIMVTAGRAYSVEHYRRLAGYLQDVASQGLIITPSEASLDNQVIGPALDQLLATPRASARDRARLFRLTWDMVCDSYAGRQTLFELFNALPWTAQRAQLVARFDVGPLKELARGVAGVGSLSRAVAAVDEAARGRAVDYEVLGRAYHTYGGERPIGGR